MIMCLNKGHHEVIKTRTPEVYLPVWTQAYGVLGSKSRLENHLPCDPISVQKSCAETTGSNWWQGVINGAGGSGHLNIYCTAFSKFSATCLMFPKIVHHARFRLISTKKWARVQNGNTFAQPVQDVRTLPLWVAWIREEFLCPIRGFTISASFFPAQTANLPSTHPMAWSCNYANQDTDPSLYLSFLSFPEELQCAQKASLLAIRSSFKSSMNSC